MLNVAGYQILGHFVFSRHGFLSVTHILYFVLYFYEIQCVLFLTKTDISLIMWHCIGGSILHAKIVVIDLQIVSCTNWTYISEQFLRVNNFITINLRIEYYVYLIFLLLNTAQNHNRTNNELIKRVFMLPSGQLYIYIFMITVIA